jgi:AcrR family transcriptional regulator
MVGRPIDYERRNELLDDAVDYAAEHGFADLSWRTVAAALGVSTTTLVHHFGTKEHLIEVVLTRLRERTGAATKELAGGHPSLAAAARAVWQWSSDPAQSATFRLFFAVYGSALQAPDRFHDFLALAGVDVMVMLRESQGAETDPAVATRMATLVIAAIRGLLLDLLSSQDRLRVDDAAEYFLATLEH